MISFENVSKLYAPRTMAVKNVSLTLEQGEFVSLVGTSGAGKTTLIKLLIAQEKPTVGAIRVGQIEVTKLRNGQIPYLRRQLGVVFQDFKLLFHKTVFENVAFALEVCGAPPARIAHVVPAVLDIVGLAEKAHHFPYQLSGGEAQRVVIARALVHQPHIVIADEPTGNLDRLNANDVIDTLLRVNELGATVVLVTHNREIVNGLKKRVVTMEHGEIVADKEKGRYAI